MRKAQGVHSEDVLELTPEDVLGAGEIVRVGAGSNGNKMEKWFHFNSKHNTHEVNTYSSVTYITYHIQYL